MQKNRVIVFTTAYAPFVGGAEVAIEETLRQNKLRFDFFIVTARLRRGCARREEREEGTVIRVGLGTAFDKWLLPFLGFWWGAARLFQKRPTLLWAMDISQGALAALFLKILFPRVPLLFTVQYGESIERLHEGRGGMIGKTFGMMLKRADCVTAISSYLLNLSQEFGYLGPARLIHNGVDVSHFSSARKKAVSSTAPRRKTIITTSRLVPKNGIDILIRAVRGVKNIIPDIRCIIIGDGPDRRALELLAASLNLSDNVFFLGTVRHQDIPSYLWDADVFVRPSRSEGMGNSFIEALAAGIPVVGTSVGGIPDIIENEKTGLFAETENPSDFARKIVRILYDEDLTRTIADAGRALAQRSFSWDRIGASYAELFSQLFSAKKRVLIVTGLFPPEIGGPATYSRLLRDEFLNYGILPAVLHFGSVRHLPVVVRHLVFLRKIFCAMRGRDILFAQDPVSVGLPSRFFSVFSRKPLLLKIVGDYAWEQAVQRFGVSDTLDDFLGRHYGWRVELLKRVERYVAGGAKKIIVPSQYLKNVVLLWGVDRERIAVIYNAYEGARAPLSKESARTRAGIFGTAIVSIGRLVPWKGFAGLIEILPSLARRISNVALFIAGSGPMGEELRLRARALGVTERVRFLGTVPPEEISYLLRGGDIFVLNSAYEGFSHTLLEAMAEGIPVVTTSVGGNPELVESEKSGILVSYNDKDALGDAIVKLVENPSLRHNLAVGANKRLQLFSKEGMLETTSALIHGL